MGKDCCSAKEEALIQLREKQARVLKIVLVINAVMFLVEGFSGIVAKSTALLADSLDMFGDAVVYGFSLFVLYRSARWRSGAALAKGIIMLIFGIGVLVEATQKATSFTVPEAPLMGAIGLLALVANTLCLVLLLRHREDDINMKSTWICSRNDILANTGVLVAAFGVKMTSSKWPDVIIGIIIATVFLRSAISVIVEARDAFKKSSAN